MARDGGIKELDACGVQGLVGRPQKQSAERQHATPTRGHLSAYEDGAAASSAPTRRVSNLTLDYCSRVGVSGGAAFYATKVHELQDTHCTQGQPYMDTRSATVAEGAAAKGSRRYMHKAFDAAAHL